MQGQWINYGVGKEETDSLPPPKTPKEIFLFEHKLDTNVAMVHKFRVYGDTFVNFLFWEVLLSDTKAMEYQLRFG